MFLGPASFQGAPIGALAGGPYAPPGFVLLVDENGDYLVDENGDYLITAEA